MAVIAIDFDNTIVEGDKALEGAKDAISRFRERGHKVIIHSCNNPKWIERTLNNLDIRFDAIWTEPGKPIADLYVDDKGWHFTGVWSKDTNNILARLDGYDNRKWKAPKTSYQKEC